MFDVIEKVKKRSNMWIWLNRWFCTILPVYTQVLLQGDLKVIRNEPDQVSGSTARFDPVLITLNFTHKYFINSIINPINDLFFFQINIE